MWLTVMEKMQTVSSFLWNNVGGQTPAECQREPLQHKFKILLPNHLQPLDRSFSIIITGLFSNDANL